MSHYLLESLERMPWADAAMILPTMSWMWADLGGWQTTEVLPATPPVATHVWGFSSDAWVRLRLDGHDVTGAQLTLHDGDGDGDRLLPAVLGSQVWPVGEQRVGLRAGADLRGRAVTLLRLPSPRALVFVHSVGPVR